VTIDPQVELAIRKRLKDDLPFYAKNALTIRTKDGQMRKFVLNRSQLYLHQRIEEQKKRTGKVRILVPKARQGGVTTYTQARYFHQCTHLLGMQAFILTHHSETTKSIFEMTDRFYEFLPPPVRPARSISNVKELVFEKLASGYRVGTAGSKAVGRGQTVQLFHGSEVAYWDNAEDHWAGVIEAVPNAAGSEIILESTSAGKSGKFYEACMSAQNKESDFEVVFLPWHWMEEYREIPSFEFEQTPQERNLIDKIKNLYGDILTNEQLMWRRVKIFNLGMSRFQREYPIDIEEAFAADAEGALWDRETINKYRVTPEQVPPLRSFCVGLDPATTAKVTSDEAGVIAIGLGQNDHLYVFGDYSGTMRPKEWATLAVQICRKGWDGRPGDFIVAETNQGGEMVEETVRGVDHNIGYKGVHEHDGKRVRAEPLALMYQQGLVHHVGHIHELENEMVTWAARSNDESPNRVDALVLGGKTLKPYQSNIGVLHYYEKLAKEAKGRK
jgi:hypothetical protein